MRELKRLYGIQAVIVPEVEVEIAWHKKFQDRYQQALDKAIHDHVLAKYDDWLPQAFKGGSATAIENSIQQLGAEYGKRVGRGEAYTLAAAVVLDQPALSHDREALDVLIDKGHQVPHTVLRVFDVLALLYQAEILTEAECDRIRQAILQNSREFVPRAFRNASFRNGLGNFCPRFQDGSMPTVGLASPAANAPPYCSRILLVRSA
ncbi:MAG: hypothetical protein ACE145_19515 [Terriglobia bacterium]